MNDNDNPVHRFLEKCDHRGLFRDQRQISKLQASTKASLIECKYYLRATTEYDSVMCCSSPPTIDIPIIIYSPEIRFFDDTWIPTNWKPTTMPSFEFSFGVKPQISISEPIINVNINTGSTAMISGGTSEPISINQNNNNNMNNNNMNMNMTVETNTYSNNFGTSSSNQVTYQNNMNN
jgi:hypothetical protein